MAAQGFVSAPPGFQDNNILKSLEIPGHIDWFEQTSKMITEAYALVSILTVITNMYHLIPSHSLCIHISLPLPLSI